MSIIEQGIKRIRESLALNVPLPAEERRGETVPIRALRQQVSLDFAVLRTAGMIPAEHERKLFSQTFRAIKRPLLTKATQVGAGPQAVSNSNIVMIASALPGEGKTFTAINLALSLALERDRQVVLIDGDVVKHDLTTRLGMDGQPGLLDALQDATRSLEQFLFQTDLPALAVLPAGSSSLHSTELLSSARMRTLVEKIASLRDCLVIFDTSPLLVTTESRAIAEIAGQAVLVVREGETPHATVIEAVRLLQACPSVSLILNQSMSSPNSGYGYAYASSTGSSEAPAP